LFQIHIISFTDLVKSAREEILIVFATANAFHRQEYLGAMQFLKDDLIVQTAQRLTEQQQEWKQQQHQPQGQQEEKKEQQEQQPLNQKIHRQQRHHQQKNNIIDIRFIEPSLQTKVAS
jgi:membrane protein involved in colicin uptake